MGEATRILQAIQRGDSRASEKLLPLVYEELRLLASRKMACESPGQTLQATALVHEAYLRLCGDDQTKQWDDRAHFFAAAAEAMRRILVEAGRRRKTLKRGGQRNRRQMRVDDVAVELSHAPSADILSLNEALEALEMADPQAAQLLKLRYFAGLTVPQASKALGISPRTANNVWAYARAWLLERLGDGDTEINK